MKDRPRLQPSIGSSTPCKRRVRKINVVTIEEPKEQRQDAIAKLDAYQEYSSPSITAVGLQRENPIEVSDSEDDVVVRPRFRRRQPSLVENLAAELQYLGLNTDSSEQVEPKDGLEPEAAEVSDNDIDISTASFHDLTSEAEEEIVYSSQIEGLNPRPATPDAVPASPNKSRLVSPSKPKVRIPAAPGLRPSLDAFWSVEEVNDWNEQHSPRKTLKSPRKNPLAVFCNNVTDLTAFSSSEDEDEKAYPSFRRKPQHMSDSNKENQPKSPQKKPEKRQIPSQSTNEDQTTPPVPSTPSNLKATEKEARRLRKHFEATKHRLAEDFIAELDATMSHNEITRLSASTGGIRLQWNPRLTRTAGVAHNRQPLVAGARVQEVWIELSDKVIDNAHNLRCTLAHEYCHLYNFVVDGERRPKESHGRAFKAVAARVVRAFAHHGIAVTTKHAYEIPFSHEYMCVGVRATDGAAWAASSCRRLEKRHGPGLKVAEFRCRGCTGQVVQVKPAPKGLPEATNLSELRARWEEMAKPRKLSAWNEFCREWQGSVRKELESGGRKVGFEEVMGELRKRYRGTKQGKA